MNKVFSAVAVLLAVGLISACSSDDTAKPVNIGGGANSHRWIDATLPNTRWKPCDTDDSAFLDLKGNTDCQRRKYADSYARIGPIGDSGPVDPDPTRQVVADQQCAEPGDPSLLPANVLAHMKSLGADETRVIQESTETGREELRVCVGQISNNNPDNPSGDYDGFVGLTYAANSQSVFQKYKPMFWQTLLTFRLGKNAKSGL